MATETEADKTYLLHKGEYYFPLPGDKFFRFLSEAKRPEDLVAIMQFLYSNYWSQRKLIGTAYRDAVRVLFARRAGRDKAFKEILDKAFALESTMDNFDKMDFQDFINTPPTTHDTAPTTQSVVGDASKYFNEIRLIFAFSGACASWMDYSTERIVSKSNHWKKAIKKRWQKNQEKIQGCISGGDSPENQKNTDYKEYYSYINNCNTLLTNQKLETPKLEKKSEELHFVVPLRMRKKIN